MTGGRGVLLFLGLVAAVAVGCGADQGYPVDGSSSDASSDAPGCYVAVSFEPSTPVAPATVVARAEVVGGTGVIDYQWTVRYGGSPVPFTPLDASSRDVQFDADLAGVYDVSVEIGFGCAPFYGQLNVQAPGANTRAVRVRLAPPPTSPVPVQERIIVVTGGADYAAGVIALDPGLSYPVAVRTPAAQPVTAYLRFVSRTTPDAIVEAFSDATGAAQVRLAQGRYDVLVVPATATLAPRVIADWDPLTSTLTVDGGALLAGTVLDGAGQPVDGARVSVTSGGAPSTVATTQPDGTFSLRWVDDPQATEVVTVVAPAGSDLPRLELSAALAGVPDATVRYAALTTVDLAGQLVSIGGSPAADTDVLVHAAASDAGTVASGASSIGSGGGTWRQVVRTDGTGALPALAVGAGPGQVFVTSGETGAAAAIDFTTPAAITAATVSVGGRVLTSAGAPLTGARVRARLIGALAHTDAASPTTITAGDGRFVLTLAAGATYDLSVVDLTAADAALRLTVTESADADLGDLDLSPALAVSGTVRVTGQSVGLVGAGVGVLCHLGCTGIDRARPLGEAVTDSAGGFIVAVPDPGIGP